MGHKHVIREIQARATRPCAPVQYLTVIKGNSITSLKAHAHWSWTSGQRTHSWLLALKSPIIGAEITTVQPLASRRHIQVKEIYQQLKSQKHFFIYCIIVKMFCTS